MRYQLILRNDDGTEITFGLNCENLFKRDSLAGVSIIEHSGIYYTYASDVWGTFESDYGHVHSVVYVQVKAPKRIDNIQGIIK